MTDKIKEACLAVKKYINAGGGVLSAQRNAFFSFQIMKKEIQGMEEKLQKIKTLCQAVTKASGLIGPQDLPSVPVAAIREILGLKAFPFKEERKRVRGRKGERLEGFHSSSDDDREAWHCSQCGSVICVDPDTGGPICPQCKTSPLKRG